jgi:hypothetical protein
MKRLAVWLALASCLAAAPALAVVPQTMSYQGVLTDNAGNAVPDGLYNFVFKIYNVPTLGAPLWTETQNAIQVTRGGFNVILGNVTPLNIAFDVQYWLGVSVNGQPELAPRVQLASSPYSLSLQLPFAGTASSAGPALSITNTGAGPAVLANPLLQVGTPTSSGQYLMYSNGIATPTAEMYAFGGLGSALDLLNPGGGLNLQLEPDIAGSGGFFGVYGGTGGYFFVDGNSGAFGSPVISINGPGSSTIFDTNQLGDASVQLPANAISAGEILDEPGIAQNHAPGGVDFSAATIASFKDITAVTITIPTAGYVTITADAQLGLFGAGLSAEVQITDVSGSVEDGLHYFGAGPSGLTTNSGWVPVSIHRTYGEAAGAHTFYFQAAKSGGTGSPYAWNSTITALFTPTAYGGVIVAPAMADLPKFDHVTQVSSAGNGPGKGPVSGVLVDLHELELKAAKQREALEATQRQIVEASVKAQMSHAHPAAAAAAPKK